MKVISINDLTKSPNLDEIELVHNFLLYKYFKELGQFDKAQRHLDYTARYASKTEFWIENDKIVTF